MDSINIGYISIMQYVIALYNNNITEEDREKVIATLPNDIFEYMKLLNDMVQALKTMLLEKGLSATEASDILEREYDLLDMNRFINYEYIQNIVLLGFYRYNPFGMSVLDNLHNYIYAAIDAVENCKDELVKTDVYCCIIRAVSVLDFVTDNIEFTQKLLDYYNSIPEEERVITFLPEALVNI